MKIINKIFLVLFLTAVLTFAATSKAKAASYYIAPDKNLDGTLNSLGNDLNNGTSMATPFKTFTKVWGVILPGDTLYLLDGFYYQTLSPATNGISGKPITVKALNDGKARLDGQGVRHVVVIGTTWDSLNHTLDSINPYGNYFTLEGLIAENSVADVYEVYAHDVTIRRCSGYNANPHDNFHVFTLWTLGSATRPSNILLEDNIAAGSGRKMMVAYQSYVNIVFRRNFAAWQYWLGDAWCGGRWPQNDGIELYPAAYENQPDILNNSIFENNINFGLTANHGTSFSPNPGLRAGNKYLGEISLGAGMKWDPLNSALIKFVPAQFNANPCSWNDTALPASCSSQGSQCNDLTNRDYRSGFNIGTFSPTLQILKNNTFSDLFAAYNASWGLSAGAWGSGSVNNTLTRMTLINNDIGNPIPLGGPAGTDTSLTDLSRFSSVSNLKIGSLAGGANPSPGSGAQLQFRYTDGSLSNTSLWPWPMEDRIKTEFADPSLFQAGGKQGQVWTNFSVTNIICQNILMPNSAVTSCGLNGSTPSPSPTSITGDINGDGIVNVLDFTLISNAFGTNNATADLNHDGIVNVLDFTLLSNNFGRTV